ncbi:MAG TPA: cytochrome c biogenesis protein ResB [Chthoniobacteraceae bacterium]
MNALWTRTVAFFTSLKLTIVCLAFSMVLIVVGTLDQVNLGIYHAQKTYFDTFFVWWQPAGGGFKLPILPGGWLLGSLLLANLLAAHFSRFTLGWWRLLVVIGVLAAQTWIILAVGYQGWLLLLFLIMDVALAFYVELRLKWQKLGITITHFGIILLLVGGLLTTLLSVESQMRIDTGQTVHYSESIRDTELAIIDRSAPEHDQVIAIPQSLLANNEVIKDEKLPFEIRVKQFMPNSNMGRRAEGDTQPSLATAGLGPRFAVTEVPMAVKMDERDFPSAFIELTKDGKSLGTYLASLWFTLAVPSPQIVEVDGKSYDVQIRPRRYYKPFSLKLLKFTHERYTGTQIPKDFASQVQLKDATNNEDREVRIFMNNPLRYGGLTFYQASFANNDKTTILQVVRNPNWVLPYIACTLVSLGLLVQFTSHLMKFNKRRAAA